MIKMKRYALLLAGLTFISLAGCGKQESPLTITDNPSSVGTSADVTSAAEPNNEIPASPSAPAESENPTDSIPETRLQAEETETPASGTEDAAEPKQPAQTEEKTNSASSTPPPKESETQKPKPAPTQPPAEEPPQSEPQETAPPEEPIVPDFNIQTWIDFAAEYATSESVGLNLSPDATACWDNPITAGPHSLYLERDIQSRLNRYARDEDITDVWIWAEERSDGSYDLYIGYA